MEYVYEYAAFAARLVTVVVVVALPVLLGLALVQARRGAPDAPSLTVRRLNDRLREMRLTMSAALDDPKAARRAAKRARKADRQARRTGGDDAGRVFVCHFTGDVRASAVASLREEITAILAVAREGDEVVVVLESGGGTIHGYGLAASQLARVRTAGVRLTAVVDKIAASGGYMMACVADRILAAPFAIVGSIGVVAQLPNFNRWLRSHDIDFEQITAGKYKRTLSLFGENTDEDREKFQAEIEDAHALFKSFIAEYRPSLDLDAVATGEHWFGTRALEIGLVDGIATSDAYLCERAGGADVFEVRAERSRSIWERVLGRGD